MFASVPDALLVGVLKSEFRKTDPLPTSMRGDSIDVGPELAAVDGAKTVEDIGDGAVVGPETACASEEVPGDVSLYSGFVPKDAILSDSTFMVDVSTKVSETWRVVETSEREMPESVSLDAFEDAERSLDALGSKSDSMMVAEGGELLVP